MARQGADGQDAHYPPIGAGGSERVPRHGGMGLENYQYRS
jgi:hypothetical protein